MQTSSRIAINAVSSWVNKAIRVAIGLVMVPFLLGKFGREGYGLMALLGVIVGITTIIDLGVRGALARHLAEQVARKDTRRFNELASTALVLYLVIGSVFAAVCVGFAHPIARVFHVSRDLMPQAVFLIRWYASISVVLSFIGPVFGATITSNNRFDLANYMAVGVATLKAVGILAVVGLTDAGLNGWAGVSLAAQFVHLLLRNRVAHRVWPSLDVRLAHFRTDALRPLFSLGGYLFVFKLTNLLSVHSDPLVITWFFSPAGVALYSPGGSMPKLARPLVRTLAGQLHPLATAYHVTGKIGKLQAVLLRGTRYTLLMGIPVCVILGIFAMPIMRLWLERVLGDDYRIAALVMIGWALVDLFTYAAGSQWPVLLGMNRLKFLVWTQVPAGILNVLVSIILVGYTPLGVPGIMVATVIIAAIRRPIITVYAARLCKVPVARYLKESYLGPALVLALLAAVAVALRIDFAPRSLPAVAACVAGVACLWVPLCWWVGFNAVDRQSFRGLLRRGADRIGLGARRAGPAAAGPAEQAIAETLKDEHADEIRQSEEII